MNETLKKSALAFALMVAAIATVIILVILIVATKGIVLILVFLGIAWGLIYEMLDA